MTHDVWYRFKKEFTQQGANFTLQGHSISARCSGFWIPEYQIMFDAGIPSPFHPLHIFITHSHSDHVGSLPTILTAINTIPTVYIPHGTTQLYKDYILAKHRLSRCNPNATLDFDEICKFHQVRDGDSISIVVAGGLLMNVQVFATEHKVPSVGYALSHIRSRLKPEFSGLLGKELAQKRKDGIELNTSVSVPCVAYVGDSTLKWMSHRIFAENDFPVILCESTFISALEDNPKRAIDAAKEHGHSEFSQLGSLIEQKIRAGSKTTFVLIHWSDRYETEKIKEFFKDKKQIFAWTN